jgi:hypothetical protein
MDLTPVLIMGFIVLGIYKIVELFVRKNERIMLIERLTALSAETGLGAKISLPDISFGSRDTGAWPLRISLLLIGLGIGFLVAIFTIVELRGCQEYLSNRFDKLILSACVFLFGGIGLLVAYFIENGKKKDSAENR